MNANKYAWVVNTADSHPWWNRTFTSVSCTPDEVYQGAKGIISVDYSFISQQKESTVSGLVRRTKLSFCVIDLIFDSLKTSNQFLLEPVKMCYLIFTINNFSDIIPTVKSFHKFSGVVVSTGDSFCIRSSDIKSTDNSFVFMHAEVL